MPETLAKSTAYDDSGKGFVLIKSEFSMQFLVYFDHDRCISW